MKLYMFRTVIMSIIRSLFTVHSAMVYVIQVCREPSSRSICSCSKAVYKPVWHIPLLSVQWINSWWWTEELSETRRVSCQNKFVKLVYLVGFIIKKNKQNLFSNKYFYVFDGEADCCLGWGNRIPESFSRVCPVKCKMLRFVLVMILIPSLSFKTWLKWGLAHAYTYP
jgi:hypothetical protein